MALPEELKTTFVALEGVSALDEDQVAQALYVFQEGHKTLDAAAEKALVAERFVFTLYIDETGEKGPWGTFFRPMITTYGEDGIRTSHPLEALSGESFLYWTARASEAKHPVLRARYSDAAWELAPLVPGSSRTADNARVAIDAYIERVEASKSIFPDVKWLRRALNLARAIHDQARVDHAVTAMFQLHDRAADPALVGTATAVFDTLFPLRKKLPLSDERVTKLIAWLEYSLGVVSSDTFKRTSPHGAEAYGERLLKHYRSLNDQPNIERVIRVYAETIERDAELAPPSTGAAWLNNAYLAYLHGNLMPDAERALMRMRELGRRAEGAMVSNVVSEKIEWESLQKFVDALTSGGLDVSLSRITAHFVPRRERIQERLRMQKENYPLTFMFPITIVDDGQPIARVGGGEQDEAGRLVYEVGQELYFSSFFLTNVMARFLERYELSDEMFTDLLYRSPLFGADRYQIVQSGVRRYWQQDYIGAIHVLVPQIEHALRRLLAALPAAGPTSSHNPNLDAFTEKDLGAILDDEGLKHFLGDDLSRYLRTLLTDQRGGPLGNLRNRVSHGLFQSWHFTREMADRVLHVLMVIGTFVRRNG